MRVHLTKLEWEILKHRLDVPDAVTQALDMVGSRADMVDVLFSDILNSWDGKSFEIPDGKAWFLRDPLIECVEGSTWVGCMVGNLPDSTISTHYRAGCSLAGKIGRAFNREGVVFPNY